MPGSPDATEPGSAPRRQRVTADEAARARFCRGNTKPEIPDVSAASCSRRLAGADKASTSPMMAASAVLCSPSSMAHRIS